MPHIILEYSLDSVSPGQLNALMEGVYGAVIDSGLFAESNIRLRATGYSDYRLGSGEPGFIHVQCRIHAGRSPQQRKALSQGLVDALQRESESLSVITCEVVEMCGESYSKWASGRGNA